MRRPVFIAILLFCSLPAQPQDGWKGDISVTYGSNFDYFGYIDRHKWTSFENSGKASIGYSGRKFSFEAGGDASYSYHYNKLVGYTEKNSGKDTTLGFTITPKSLDKMRTRAFLKSGFSITSQDRLDFNYTYGYEHDEFTYANVSLTFEQIEFNGGTSSLECGNNLKNKHSADLIWSHHFLKPGRTFTAEYGFRFIDDEKFSEWDKENIREDIISGDIVYDSTLYRIKPYLFEYGHRLKMLYSEKNFAETSGLDMDFSLTLDLKKTKDHQRAERFIDNEWRDSTDYRENFYFDEFSVSPTVHCKYVRDFFTVDASYTPQIYTKRLDNDSLRGYFDDISVSHLINVKNIFELGKNHRVSVVYDRTVNRPGYLQVCWFERDGSRYSNIKYRGDPDLRPQATHKINLSYTYDKGRFTVSPGFGYEYKFRIIEQTYEELENPESGSYRLYTWINGGHSHTTYASMNLSWKGRNLKADLGGKYNYFHGESNNGNITLSADYKISGDVSYNLKTWSFMARCKYESKIIRSYTKRDAVVNCDVRVEKSLWKFTLFLEGIDLLDRDITVTTLNASQTESRTEELDNNNRLFRMGAVFKF